MKKSIFPNMLDLLHPLYFALPSFALYFVLHSIIGTKAKDIDLAAVCTDFGITFAAFSITALSLLPLLQTKEWYSLFKKLDLFDDIVVNYRNSIWMNLAVLLYGVIGKLLLASLNGKIVLFYNSISVFFIVFIAVFLFRNVQVLIELLLHRDK